MPRCDRQFSNGSQASSDDLKQRPPFSSSASHDRSTFNLLLRVPSTASSSDNNDFVAYGIPDKDGFVPLAPRRSSGLSPHYPRHPLDSRPPRLSPLRPELYEGTTRTQSLDEEPSKGVLEVRRQSIATRSRSLNTAPSVEQKDTPPPPAAPPEKSPIVIGKNKSVEDLQDLPLAAPNGTSKSGVLASFKAKYSTTVVGQGAENCSWSFLLSIPHLIMMSNLQSFFGSKGSKKPSIQPNEYMDNIIGNMKAAMQER